MRIIHTGSVSYPPEPWHLQGGAYAAVWSVRLTDVAGAMPSGAKPITWGGRALMVTSLAMYGRGSVLEYNELIAAVAVRVRLRPVVTVTHIWVDSPASAAGGRALWGIPKEIGSFEVRVGEALEVGVSAQGRQIASLRFGPGLSLPGRWGASASAAQMLGGRLKLTRFCASGRFRLGRGTWRFEEAGPLRFLSGRKPLVSLRVDQLDLRFGIGK